MAEDFARHIARVVASQVAESTGFDACQDSAIEILGDLLLRYLGTVCSSSHSYAELAGRTQSNFSDVLLALDDLNVTPEDLYQHMQLQATDVPFAHTLAPFPVHTQQALPPTFADRGEQPPDHIPRFLPAFPDPHTYQHTPAYAGHQTDPHKQRQSMLEAKQKSEAALHKLHQRISSKVSQPDTNPFLAAPAVEQLPVQLPELSAAAAAAAAIALGGSSAGGAGAAAAGAGAAAALANGPTSSSQPAAANSIGKAAAAAGGLSQQQSQQQLQQQPLLRRQQLAAAAAAGGDEVDEDMLFESAAVLKAFSAILPPDLLAQHAERLQGVSEEQQQQRSKQRRNNGAAEAANGLEDIIIEEEGPSAMDVDGAADASGAAVDPAQSWLSWDKQRDLQQDQQQQQQPSELLGPAGAVGPELLRFGIDPVAADKSTAVRLAGRERPADAFAERSSSGKGGAVAVGGSGRQRKSKYDADPTKQRAEGILAANPEALFATGPDGQKMRVFGELGDDDL